MRHYLWLAALITGVAVLPAETRDPGMPHLERRGTATELVVDGQTFLILAAEIHNSSSSNLDYMRPIWPRLAAIPVNTVLTPVSWELVEPEEGHFQFSLVDGLIEDARRNHLHLVFLWLASWKNGMSSYAPVWVKRDTQRFPRVVEKDGRAVEILSPLGEETRAADARAFAALMRHIREVDGARHTVLMMQVENEVGVLGDSRDRSPAANRAFDAVVPSELMAYLGAHRDSLIPEFRKVWEDAGAKTSGTWQEVFGPGPGADKIFMAWNYGRFVQAVTAAGKVEYPMPMYVNTWLAAAAATPGEYPSGGPLPEVMDLWMAAGSAIDLFAPDIYAMDFSGWCERYHRAGNPLFIPETGGGSIGKANVFYAIGAQQAMGFSPFGVDSWEDSENELGKSYAVLGQIAPLILAHQGDGKITGFLLSEGHPAVTATLGDYELQMSLDEIFGSKAKVGFGLVIAIGPDEFLGAGSGFRVAFKPRSPGPATVGLASVDEGSYAGGAWIPGRRLNGDENDQGRQWRFSSQRVSLEKARLYRY